MVDPSSNMAVWFTPWRGKPQLLCSSIASNDPFCRSYHKQHCFLPRAFALQIVIGVSMGGTGGLHCDTETEDSLRRAANYMLAAPRAASSHGPRP